MAKMAALGVSVVFHGTIAGVAIFFGISGSSDPGTNDAIELQVRLEQPQPTPLPIQIRDRYIHTTFQAEPGEAILDIPKESDSHPLDPIVKVPADPVELRPWPKKREGQRSPPKAPVLAAARPTSSPLPEYPSLARRKGWEGDVTVAFDVNTDGAVRNATVSRPSGHPTLDEACVAAVSGWTFQPSMRDGVAEESRLTRTFEFRLQTGAPAVQQISIQ